jgi:MtfA peptidase
MWRHGLHPRPPVNLSWTALALALLLPAAVAAWLAGPPLWTAWRRAHIRRQPFPAAWRALLRQRMPSYRRLPADQQLRLKKHVQVLLAEVPFIGCAGQPITDEVRVLVAAQAALLQLGRRQPDFPALRQVLVYPAGFVVPRRRTEAGGVVHEQRQALLGESWQHGLVVLSWADVLAGAADPQDGRNVVLHEFAHQLDQASGGANGTPWIPGRERARRWAAVMSAEYATLRQRLARGEAGLIDPYGATDPAEFFAVVTELYFERGAVLAQAHPALFAVLAEHYRVDTRAW